MKPRQLKSPSSVTHFKVWNISADPADTVANNLAHDWQMFADCEAGKIGPTIRLYTWSEPGVSVGYLQSSLRTERGEKLAPVRRPTGGGLVYHETSEVVYCLVAPVSSGLLPAKLTAAYLMITKLICQGLIELGYPVELGTQTELPGLKHRRNELCFTQAENFEIVLNGEKVVGSAQRRTRNTVLQQGTIKTDLFNPRMWNVRARRINR